MNNPKFRISLGRCFRTGHVGVLALTSLSLIGFDIGIRRRTNRKRSRLRTKREGRRNVEEKEEKG